MQWIHSHVGSLLLLPACRPNTRYPKTAQGQRGVLVLPWTTASSQTAALSAQQAIAPAPCPSYYGQYQQRSEPIELLFEPWEKENQLGHQSWIARTLPEESKVVLKVWDG